MATPSQPPNLPPITTETHLVPPKLPPPADARHDAAHRDARARKQTGYIKANDYASAYSSGWTRLHHEELQRLQHVNCTYLSTTGTPPTLLALKQHAQSLCSLLLTIVPTVDINEINPGPPAENKTTADGQAGGGNQPDNARRADMNSAFDWLNDLGTPYTNADPTHQRPLNELMNNQRAGHDIYGPDIQCPLQVHDVRKPGMQQRPYANHHLLVVHANDCLERLDHEFSATGGLLSMLPADGEADDGARKDARNTLLGQWLYFTQHLVARMHELEIAYGNALDIIKGEAVVPLQALSSQGPDARRDGRVVAFPQDRWVLANTGDEVFAHIHRTLDQKEVLRDAQQDSLRAKGVVGTQLWQSSGEEGKSYARGIVSVDISTRFFRLAGREGGHGTLFVVPGWGEHPGVAGTREAEARPTVVSSVQPQFPQRATALERRLAGDARAARGAAELQRDAAVGRARHQLATVQAQLEREARLTANYEAAAGEGVADATTRLARAQGDLLDAQEDMRAVRVRTAQLSSYVAALRQALVDAGLDVPQMPPPPDDADADGLIHGLLHDAIADVGGLGGPFALGA